MIPIFKNQKPKNNQTPKNDMGKNIFLVILFLFVISVLFSGTNLNQVAIQKVSLSQLATSINNNEVKEIIVRGQDLEITLNNNEKQESKKESESSLSESLSNLGVLPESIALVSVDVQDETGFDYWLVQLLPFLIPLVILGFLIWFLTRQMKGAGMKAFTFGQSRARVTDPDKQQVTFKDVAGVAEAKSELLEIVEFLKQPKKFLDIGARIPKGVLLMGGPGTGKTLLARAVAGEARVPFFHLSGSEFVEMFVGVGASRVRDLFQTAKKVAPAIIFIDEIDAVGRSRGVGVGGGNDEREQTLNQILVEMDGFEPNDKIIVIAATNRPDVLDPALLRPGRFDRRVVLDPPDRKDRLEILKIHARNKPLGEDVNLELVAQRTPGFSGADLYSLMNEAAIFTARENRKKVTQFDIMRSIEKVMIGPERKSHLHTSKEREIVAYHEAGHAVLSSVLDYADPVHKVSIVARGRAGGYTLKLPIEEKKLSSRNEFLDDIVVSMGGYVAEKMVMGDITTGPSNDLLVATGLARNMVTKWGMSTEIGPIALVDGEGRMIFGGDGGHSEHSNETAKLIDDEIKKIINNSLIRAQDLLTQHRVLLDAIAKALLEKETLEQEEYNIIIKAHNVEPKQAEISNVGKVIAEPLLSKEKEEEEKPVVSV